MTVQSLDVHPELAQQLRVDSIRCSTSAGSGHPTSSMSAADLMAVLMARHFRYDWQRPDNPANDHLIFSKGHASPLLYSMFKAAGVVSDDELMTGYRRFGSRLEGHPTPVLPWVDVATGSLGQGLPDGVGVALAGRYLDELPFRVWVLCGDSEMAEGSDMGGVRQGVLLPAEQLDRDRGREPPRPTRPDRTGLGPRRLRPAGRGVRLPGHRRSTATTSARSKGLRGCGRGRPAHCDPGPHPQRPRVHRGRGPRGLARQASAGRDGREGHHRAGRRTSPHGARAAAGGGDRPGTARAAR